jgi:polysaccharide pyruvyl transferase CsaB
LNIKVLTLISGGDVGGAKTHVLSLLKKLNESIKADMICFTEGVFVDDARAMGIPTRVLNSGNIFKDIATLKEIVVSEKYDIIHSHGSRGNFMATAIKRCCGLPLVSTVHSDYRLDYLGRPLANITYGTINKIALRKIDFLIGVSDRTSEILISRGFKPDCVYTIYNGIDMSGEMAVKPRREFLKALGVSFPEDSIFVGIAARLQPVKDVATMIRGFAIAAKKEPRLRLLVAGDGPEEANLKSLAKELGVDDKVAFLGWIKDMNSFYAALDINGLSSLSETFAYALTEGARYALPTVSSDVGGVGRLIDNGVSGFLFEPGDAETLAKYLTALAPDEKLRSDFGNKLYEKTKKLFSLDATCNTQLEIYKSILRKHGHKADKRYGIVICGAYGMGNIGDESILEAILAEIKQADPDIPVYVLSRNPKETRKKNRVRSIYTFNILSFLSTTSKASLYINGGGNLMQDDSSRRSLWFYLYTIVAAKKRGAKVIMYGCGIGPINYRFNRKLSAKIINKYVDAITLREDASIEELKSMGVIKPEILLAADPALSLLSESEDRIKSIMLTNGMLPDGGYICFMVRDWPGFEEKVSAFAGAADYVYEKHGLTPVFLTIDRTRDCEPTGRITRLMKAPYFILDSPFSSGEVIGIMSKMAAVVSIRLHGLIFASGHGVPLVGIVYEPKVSAFLDYIGQSNYMELEDVSEEKLVAAIEKAIEQGRSEEQAEAVARLWELEKVNRQALDKLLNN